MEITEYTYTVVNILKCYQFSLATPSKNKISLYFTRLAFIKKF